MLRITLDINGRNIGTIGVWNTGEYDGDQFRYQVHDLRGHSKDGGYITDYPKITDVWHDRSDGAAQLTERVMAEVSRDHLDQE